MRLRELLSALAVAALAALHCPAGERSQNFDRDPGWDGHNNRAETPEPREVRQDFGYSRTQHAGGKAAGEIGGLVTPAAEAAYYAKVIEPVSFDDRLTASGTFACTARHFHVLVGFFNSDTLNEWRTPNTIVLRLYGRGDVFYAYVEYMTSRWRAGGDSPGGFAIVAEPDTGRQQLRGFKSGEPHTWSLVCDPAGNNGGGSITVTIDDETAICHLDEGHKQDGATFNRFGLLNVPKHYDQGGEVWLDDLTIQGRTEHFDRDPGWEARGNRRTHTTYSVRPRFDFGFTPTNFAGGGRSGEMGGEIFRGDCRSPETLAYYGDRLELLTPNKPLRASGKLSLHRAISDSTVLIGFFHSDDSVAVSDSQSSGFPMTFLGAAIEGPSREGFLFYAVYRFPNGADGYARGPELPHVLPNGDSHEWSIRYDPGAGEAGRLTVTLDGQHVALELGEGHRDAPARFNRFGIVTTWIDGNSQRVYFDDLTYTASQR